MILPPYRIADSRIPGAGKGLFLQAPVARRATRPTAASKRRRLQEKAARGQLKRQRGGAANHD